MISRFFSQDKVPVILQYSATECGLASLAMILAYYGVNLPLEKLREECGTSRDGTKAAVLMKVAMQYKFTAEAFRVELDDLKKIDVPVIAFWNFTHYVVIKKVGKKSVYINDPAQGRIVVSYDEFDKLFTGVIIIISPTNEISKININSNYSVELKKWMSGFAVEYFFLFICLLIVIICPLLTAQISSIFVNYCLLTAKVNWIPWLTLLSLLITILFLGATWIHKWNQFKTITMAVIHKSSRAISHSLKLPMIFYALRQKSEIIAVLVRIESVIDMLFKNGAQLFASILTCIVCLLFMFKVDYVLASLSSSISCISVIFYILISKINLSYEKNSAIELSKVSAHSLSAFRNFETIKASGMEDRIIIKWFHLFCQKISVKDKLSTLAILVDTVNKLIESLAMLLILYWGSTRVFNGTIMIGQLIAYYALHMIFYKNIMQFIQSIQQCQTAYISHLRVNDLLHYPVDNRFSVSKTKTHLITNTAIISCENIKFYYNPQSQPVLSDITLDIQYGQHIAFVGTTGSGKSTLVKLLCALCLPSQGNIKIANKNITDLSQSEIAGLCAYVSQDVTLFSGSIYENLTLWKAPISIESIQQAVKIACLEDVISKRGMYGRVEEGGHNFSGGERQRIDVARSLLQNTPILILDEATSALDSETEAQLIFNLRQLDKTIIYVAHRLSTISHCDNIVVLDKGNIIEQGSHHFLLNNKKHYFNLIQNEVS